MKGLAAAEREAIALLHPPLGGVGAGKVSAAIWVHNLGLAAVTVGQATVEDEIDLLRYVPEHYRELIDQILIAHWTELVADCYTHYLQQGRGLMGLFMEGSSLSPTYLSWSWLQMNWDELSGDIAPSVQKSIQRLVPRYNPETECVFLFEFPGEEDSAVMRVTEAAAVTFSQRSGVAVPRIRRAELLTPKAAYQALLAQSPT